MAMIPLPTEFRDLLKLLNAHDVKYLIIGGYAVAYHGYPRTTGDIDIWVERSEKNANRTVEALKAFGFDLPELRTSLFKKEETLVRMGYPPLRVEIMTSISGVEFEKCYENRIDDELGGVIASVIGLSCLKQNKLATGRLRDLSDLEYLP